MQNLSNVNSNAQEIHYQSKISELEAYGLYDEMLNECYPSWNGYSPAHILKNIDQVAYRCGFNDYTDTLAEDCSVSAW